MSEKMEQPKSCSSSGGSAGDAKQHHDEQQLKETLEKINNTIIVMSGKGGVGKSTVAVNLAVSLAQKGHKTGLLDIDIHGPSVPKLLGLEKERIGNNGIKLIPIEYGKSLKVISIGFLIEDSHDPVVWRGPLKYGVINQFLKDVFWEDLDYLIVDSPPGTGDEPLSICQLIEDPTGAVIVTTPQDVALIDVKKSITFCNQVNMPIIGVIENMSGFTCPHCSETIDIFKSGGGKTMAEEMGVPFIGSIPLNASIVEMSDAGKPVTAGGDDTDLKASFNSIVENIVNNDS